MHNKITYLYSYGLHSDHIAKALGVPHRAVIKHLPELDSNRVLTRAVQVEIRHTSDATLKELEVMYNSTYSKIHHAKYNTLAREYYIPHPCVSHEDALMLYVQEGNPSHREIRRWAQEHSDHAPVLGQPVIQLVQALLPSSLTYIQIADELHLSLSYVKLIAKESKHRRSRQGELDMPQILQYAAVHSISKAADKYDISKGTIYYHQRKQQHET